MSACRRCPARAQRLDTYPEWISFTAEVNPSAERSPVAAWAIVQSADGMKAEAKISNMSDRGCRILTPKPFSIGEHVRLDIERLGYVEAEVRWTAVGAAGVQFLHRKLSPSPA